MKVKKKVTRGGKRRSKEGKKREIREPSCVDGGEKRLERRPVAISYDRQDNGWPLPFLVMVCVGQSAGVSQPTQTPASHPVAASQPVQTPASQSSTLANPDDSQP